MANIDVNLAAAQAAAENLQTATNKIKLAADTMSSNPFNALCNDPNIAGGYVNEFNQSLSEMLDFSLNKVLAALIKYIEDLSDDQPIPGPGPGDNGGGPGGPGNPGPIDPGDPTDPNGGEQINDDVVTGMSDLTLNELDNVVDSLIDMSKQKGKGLDEMLADETMADELKALLLASPYLSDELKKLIENTDSQVLRKTIQSIMKGLQPEVFKLNPLNVGIVYSYLSKVASENGITLEQLLTDPQYADLLKSTLAGFGDAVDLIKGWETLSPEECQKQLLDIYDGNGIQDKKPSAVAIVRTFVDYISEATQIDTESLLTDTKYAEILHTATQEFGKTAVLINAASHYTTEGAQEVVGNLFNGKNPGALGMNNEEVTGFKAEMDALAKSNGVTTETLLTNEQYADAVKDALANSKNAEEVGLIFAKNESSVSQNVAKNLYNTQIETKTETSTNTTTTTT